MILYVKYPFRTQLNYIKIRVSHSNSVIFSVGTIPTIHATHCTELFFTIQHQSWEGWEPGNHVPTIFAIPTRVRA